MKKYLLILVALFMVQALAAQEERPVFSENEIYIGLKAESAINIVDEAGKVNREAFLKTFAEVIQDQDLGTLEAPFFSARGIDLQWVLRISVNAPDKIESFVNGFFASEATHYAERVPIFYLSYTPNDLGTNSYGQQWHLYQIKAQEAWEYSKGDRQVKVAIVDDACQIDHPDLAGQIWTNPGEIPNNGIDDDNNGYVDDVHGYDVGGLDNDPMPNNNNFTHGTHCSGIVGASSDNSTGIASIGFNISLVPVKCTTTGQTNTQSIPRGYEGITYAVAAGADVISCSWGSSFGGSTGAQVVSYANNSGALVVAAMGNDYNEQQQYPASYTGVISVVATGNKNDQKASYSNYHTTSVISAPGSQIRSTVTNNGYASQSGTSMATPLVAGLLGLMKSHMYGIETSDLKNCLLTSADNIDSQNGSYVGKMGAGRINAEKSLICVDNLKNVPPDIHFTLENSVYCPNSYVKFSAGSNKGLIDSFYWEFPGGTPSFSTDAEPVVYFSGNGSQSYFLTAFNKFGQDKDSVVNGITFSDQGKAIALSSGFETGLAGSIWTVNNDNNNYGWEDYNFIVGTDTNKVIRVKAYGSGTNNLVSEITSAAIDMSDYGNPFLSFEFAYARRSSTATDSLFIEVSTDGGNTFEPLYADALSTVLNVSGTSSGSFAPVSNAQWCKAQGLCLSIDMKKYNRNPSVQLRIRHKGRSNSNNLYLDNIRVEGNCAVFNTDPAVAATSTKQTDACGPVTVEFGDKSLNYPSSYQWYFPGATPSESDNPDVSVSYDQVGNYDVIYVVQNQFGKDSVVWNDYVRIHALPTVTVTTSDTLICKGESITLTGDGASTYTWSPLVAISSTTGKVITASPSTSVTYTVEGKDAFGCANTATVSIDVLAAPGAPTLFRTGSKLYISVQTGVSYQWYLNGVEIPGADGFEYEMTASGTYEVKLTNTTTGCETWSREPLEYIFTSVPSIQGATYRIYPNPANQSLRLEQDEVIGTYQIYAADGRLIASGYEASNQLNLSSTAWANGVYIISWESGDVPIRERFLIQH